VLQAESQRLEQLAAMARLRLAENLS